MTTGDRRSQSESAAAKTSAGHTAAAQRGSAAGADEAAPLRTVTEHGIAWLTLCRPERRNALSLALLDALLAALRTVAEDSAARVAVLRGSGPAFCAGHDLAELREHQDPSWQRALFARCSELMLAIEALPIPVLAEVHGIATAAGCQLVATCDLAVAAASARFATPGVNIGLFCSTPMVALSRAVPPKQALRMLFTGEPIDAGEALRMGLVGQVVPDAALGETVRALATTIAAKPRATLAIGKRTYRAQRALGLDAAYAVASEAMVENMAHAEATEGIAAFLEKRAPRW
jgi:enoyl-CoA hydratase/carnithine racemase